MKAVSIHDAKTNLSKYIAAAKNGEKIYIGSFGKPEVELKIIDHEANGPNSRRQLGLMKDSLWVAPDAFSREADEEVATQIYGDPHEFDDLKGTATSPEKRHKTK